MPIRLLPTCLRRAFLSLCLGASLTVFALSARADDPPKFSAPEVNDFVKKFSRLVDDYVKAIKAKDTAKMKELGTKSEALEDNALAVESRLKPEESDAFANFMAAQAQRMMAAAIEAPK